MELLGRLLGGDHRDVVGQRAGERLRDSLTGGPPSTETLATCPVAWTPVSVRPATASLSQRG